MNYLLIIPCFLVFGIAHAQMNDSLNTAQIADHMHKPTNQWGVSINISQIFKDASIAAPKDDVHEHVFIRKYLSAKTALRFGLGFKNLNQSVSILDTLGGFQADTDSSFKQNQVYISFGVEKHIKTGSKLDPYFAPFISYAKVSNSTAKNLTVLSDTVSSSSVDISYQRPGENLFKIGLALGANYFIAKNLALGGEFGVGYFIRSQGGDFSTVRINRTSSGTEIVNREVGTLIETSSGFSMLGSGKLTLSYFF